MEALHHELKLRLSNEQDQTIKNSIKQLKLKNLIKQLKTKIKQSNEIKTTQQISQIDLR